MYARAFCLKKKRIVTSKTIRKVMVHILIVTMMITNIFESCELFGTPHMQALM
jgi:hypothetical protein